MHIISNWQKQLTALALMAGLAFSALAESPDVPVLSPEDLENFQFEQQPSAAPEIKELNVGQRHILSTMRRDIKDLLARRAGIMRLSGDVSDLRTLQLIVDRKLIASGDVRLWQSLGVVFGDILAQEHDLGWVSYEDELGASKALRWRETNNFVFPVTVFSKRVQFREDIDVAQIYADIGEVIARFKRAESLNPGG